MRFLLYEDLSPEAAEAGRGLGLDMVSVGEVGRRGYPYVEQLRYAAEEGRVLVTRNREDFLLLIVEFYRAGEPHAGVLFVGWELPNDRPEEIARALKRAGGVGAVSFL